MQFKNKILIFLISSITLLSSCVSKEKMVYLQSETKNEKTLSYEPVLQADDVLLIVVSSENPEVAAPYNLKSVSVQSNSETEVANQRLLSYLVNKEGEIMFPLLGAIKVGGLTITEATDKIKLVLKDHVKDAVVSIRILNFKISVLGEVQKPGTFSIESERVTILEALSMAGDLTIYGKRKNILLIREKEGVKTMERIDLTKPDFLNSTSYYLTQNDVIYVEPNKTRINSSGVGPNLTITLSAISVLVTILAITIK